MLDQELLSSGVCNSELGLHLLKLVLRSVLSICDQTLTMLTPFLAEPRSLVELESKRGDLTANGSRRFLDFASSLQRASQRELDVVEAGRDQAFEVLQFLRGNDGSTASG